MSQNYLFTLQPTFTQGLILGQLSILFLLALILKYLFLESSNDPASSSPTSDYPFESYHRHHHKHTSEVEVKDAALTQQQHWMAARKAEEVVEEENVGFESAEWFNMLIRQVVQTYRSKLRDDLPGPEGDEIARQRIEDFANKMRPTGVLDPIRIHSVDLGISAPRLSNARLKPHNHSPQPSSEPELQAQFELSYTDTVSISLSTACLFNYPFPSFARLPVSLTISLSLFSSPITLTAPIPTHHSPTLTLSLPPPTSSGPGFTLNLKTTSLMGSRAKLADVPKVGELIEMQIRKALSDRGTWKIVLPGLGTVEEAKEEIKKEHEHKMEERRVKEQMMNGLGGEGDGEGSVDVSD
ncbi:hypothetical protein JAAARDRAFT_29813 [Jaapia argillacea MUCL 33604]|uniref:Maintenance of mitochondrial morphology protein 1 n=1 Tax=Jaapia argillacea MUCL 33604 TaxID=933084 RepID=A0A067QJR8_9AGAM|nr:hypothetical protein JAAARDRAFT_29813 [Jaapia argillacea MUCL 33604]